MRLLNSHQVKYLLVGGYSVAIHGHPRFTSDMDIWVSSDAENSINLTAAVREFGYDLPEVEPGIFQKDNCIVRFGNPPYRIELMTYISGVTFNECYQNRLLVNFDGLKVSTISRDDLITNKRAAGRSQDLADLEQLE